VMIAAAEGDGGSAGGGNVLGALGEQLQGGIEIALREIGERAAMVFWAGSRHWALASFYHRPRKIFNTEGTEGHRV
jgi:hypothetical protein